MGLNGPNFLGIGLPELMFIVILGLVVLGPDRLPTVAKDLIRAFFRIRNLSKDLTGQLEAELGFDELKELRELKGMKTGGLVEAWANDELDLDLDRENSVTEQIEEEKKRRGEGPGERELSSGATRPRRSSRPRSIPCSRKNKAARRMGRRTPSRMHPLRQRPGRCDTEAEPTKPSRTWDGQLEFGGRPRGSRLCRAGREELTNDRTRCRPADAKPVPRTRTCGPIGAGSHGPGTQLSFQSAGDCLPDHPRGRYSAVRTRFLFLAGNAPPDSRMTS